MGLAWETMLLIVLGVVDLAILLWIVVTRLRSRRHDHRRLWVREFMRVAFPAAPVDVVVSAFQRDHEAFMSEYMELADSVELPEEQQLKVQQALARAHLFPRLLADLRSPRASRRKRAAVWLGYALPDQAVQPLVGALESEQSPAVRIHLVYALARLGKPAVIPTILDTLAGSDETYQNQIYGLLAGFGSDFYEFFPILRSRSEPEIQYVLARAAADRSDHQGADYLARLVRSDNRGLAVEATGLLLANYIHAVDVETLLGSPDLMVVNLTLEAIGGLPPNTSLDPLLVACENPDTRKSAIVGLSRLVHDRPETYLVLADRALADESARYEDALLEVLANRVEYLIERVLREPETPRRRVLELLIRSGRASGVLAFLNRNEDSQTEASLARIVRDAVTGSTDARRQFAMYARTSVLERLELEREEVEQKRGARVGESVRPLFVYAIIFATVLAPIAVHTAVRVFVRGQTPELGWMLDYTRDFTLFFGYYAFTLNLIYLLLLAFAARAVRIQHQSLRIKPLTMLFSPRMLPSISIVAPAYNEESTIVESVNSLLNLRYPDFEIIVVNDGSADRTLRVLIESFELERSDIFLHGYLETQAVRGIYRNPRIPELIVLDKNNGGKADSLNAGINASRKEYFAAIDSDSLLERDSLLRLAGRFLDSDVPVVATGGNILPINGCDVSRGKLDRIRLPHELLGRFQTLEYLRSFMAGRTGWAGINSLMIISGAFGLFRKQDVIDSHGYLTGSGYYAKDTVAEDMELVVRVARNLRESGRRFAIQYGYNANCWTEVPTTHAILRNQRDRWQRGLIDTMFYHIRMLGNPRYGSMGIVGFPYFFFFELLGPWLEIQGFLFLIAGVAGGQLSPAIVSLVIAATIPLGIAVSLSSILLAEHHQRYFRRRDRVALLVLAFVENFGYRQYAGLLRLRGYLSVLARKTGWGTMVRAGIGRTSQHRT